MFLLISQRKTNHRPMLLVSFIVTDYNLPVSLLRECLDSILALKIDPEEREIILVDDGSDVSPWDELKDYHEQVVYLRQDNQGPSVARNTGLDHAQGKYVQFVDGDDCLIKSNYDIVVSKLRNSGTYFDTEIIMFRYSRKKSVRWSVAKGLKLFWYLSNKEYLEKKNLRSGACGHVVRRDIVGKLRFTPGIFHEDEEFTALLLLSAHYVLFTSLKTYFYREREKSTTHNTDTAHIAKRMGDFLGVILRLRHTSLTSDGFILRRRIHQLTMDYIYNAIQVAEDYGEFSEYVAPLMENRLLPMTIKRYTWKYFLFSIISRSEGGRKLLYRALKR